MKLFRLFKDLFRDYRFAFSFCVLCVLLILAVFSVFAPNDPSLWDVAPKDEAPSFKHLLGTNSKGQDVFWEATFAVRNSLIISVIAGSVSRLIAVIIGMVAVFESSLSPYEDDDSIISTTTALDDSVAVQDDSVRAQAIDTLTSPKVLGAIFLLLTAAAAAKLLVDKLEDTSG